jgi:hypothetical protein
MKRYALIVCATLLLTVSGGVARAGVGSLCYSGYQPWWNIFAHRPCLTPEEKRLQHFWHDYYHALKEYYCALDHIDWVAYYKNHGYPIGGGGGCGNGACGMGNCQINYAPVFVSPTMQWALPTSGIGGGACASPSGPMMGMGGN